MLRLSIVFLALFLVVSASSSSHNGNSLEGISVLVTAPSSYAPRLERHLQDAGATVFCRPMIVTDFFVSGTQDEEKLMAAIDKAEHYDYVAFTSRKGIQAFLKDCNGGLVKSFSNKRPTPIALGVDAEELFAAGVPPTCVLVPQTPTPQGIVDMLQDLIPTSTRSKIRVLCPVPKVVDLTEPPVVPDFLAALQSLGLGSVDRVNAYETRWNGNSPDIQDVVSLFRNQQLSAIAISSTAEVEGLQKLLGPGYLELLEKVQVVAHGPVTARGARNLGFPCHGISENSSSFAGMVGALEKLVARENGRAE